MELGLAGLAAAMVVAAWIVARRSPTIPGDRSVDVRLDQAVAGLASLSGILEERRYLEERTAEAAVRIERLVAGSFGRGRSGENLLAAALDEFPPDMLVRDFRIGGRVCEFALRMSDGRLLPIDSKWAAMDRVLELGAITDPAEAESHRKSIESAVCKRVKEVAGYIDPAHTIPMAVIAVPDSVYSCCRKVHAIARSLSVVIVSYSLALPFLLTTWHLHQTYSRGLDADLLLVRAQEVHSCLKALDEKIEGHLARALKTAENALIDMRSSVAAASASLAAMTPSEEGKEVAL